MDHQRFYPHGELPLYETGIDGAFLQLMARLKTASAEAICAHILERFDFLDQGNRHEMEKYFNINQFWGTFHIGDNDYGVFKNRAAMLTSHAEDFLWLYKRLDDYKSRYVLRSVISNWIDLNFSDLSAVRELFFSCYFDPDLVSCGADEVLVDLGAFEGETVIEYCKTYGVNYKKIYCYEITPASVKTLRLNLFKKWGLKNIDLRQKGVGAQSGAMYVGEHAFTPTGNALSSSGKIAVEVVSLDEDISEPITFLKMDIEGAEQAAIRGGQKHIVNNKPKLALSLYHNNEDIWKIPRMIDEICPGYRFHLRYGGGDLVPTELTLIAVY